MEKNFIDEFIPSKDTRAYLHSIVTDYGEYSDQEIQMVKGIKRAAEFVQAHHRHMTNGELL